MGWERALVSKDSELLVEAIGKGHQFPSSGPAHDGGVPHQHLFPSMRGDCRGNASHHAQIRDESELELQHLELHCHVEEGGLACSMDSCK